MAADQVLALGADDYIMKPFEPSVLDGSREGGVQAAGFVCVIASAGAALEDAMADEPSNSRAAVGGFVWSPDQMIARLGGDEGLVRELAALFLSECPRMMAVVRDSVEQGSADAVRRAAHTFKGSVSNFSTLGPAVTAFELETLGRDGRVAEAPAVLARLEIEVAALLDQLRAFDAER